MEEEGDSVAGRQAETAAEVQGVNAREWDRAV